MVITYQLADKRTLFLWGEFEVETMQRKVVDDPFHNIWQTLGSYKSPCFGTIPSNNDIGAVKSLPVLQLEMSTIL